MGRWQLLISGFFAAVRENMSEWREKEREFTNMDRNGGEGKSGDDEDSDGRDPKSTNLSHSLNCLSPSFFFILILVGL